MLTVREVIDRDEWERFLGDHPEANFLQSWYWGEFHKRLGKKIFRSGFYDGKKLCGVMLSVIEPARRAKYLTVPGGPIIDWEDEALIALAFSEMRNIAGENKCVFVRIRPQLEENERSINIFKKNGCKSAPMYLHAELTSQLDITGAEEELMSAMRKTTRYEIRKAINTGVKTETTKDIKQVKKFYDIQMETAKRQHFVGFSFNFFKEQFEEFFNADKALLYTATFEKKVLAQAFIIFYGKEAVYHYGASTEDGRKYPGAYLLQWEAIKEAKRRGMTRYNFWGVAPEGEGNHRFSGISIFKRGFGGEDVKYLHAQDLIIDKSKYFINYLIEEVRKKIRKV